MQINTLFHNNSQLLSRLMLFTSARALLTALPKVTAIRKSEAACALITWEFSQRELDAGHRGDGSDLHAANILINLGDDSAALDDDSSTLIRNEAIEPRDARRGRKCVSARLMK